MCAVVMIALLRLDILFSSFLVLFWCVKMGLWVYVIVYAFLPSCPIILWIELGGKSKYMASIEFYRVKLTWYVHGLVRTLDYNALFVDHGHRQSENMNIFFRIRRTERGTKSHITYQFSLQEHFFALSLVLFFLITSMSSNLSVSISISRHVFK